MEKVAPEKEAPTAEIKAEIKTEKEDPCSKFPVEPVHSSDAASDLEATKAGPGISLRTTPAPNSKYDKTHNSARRNTLRSHNRPSKQLANRPS